jgi:uncharacterized pyridoxamine 5'-phosphate oxidase family protein
LSRGFRIFLNQVNAILLRRKEGRIIGMEKIVNFLNSIIDGFLATLEDGKPRVRPYQFMLEDNGTLCFSTNNTKEVCKQLKADPSMEFSCTNAKGGWIRLRGEVKFTNSVDVKEKILAKSTVVRGIYKTSDHPNFEVFYLDHGSAQLVESAGQPLEKIDF